MTASTIIPPRATKREWIGLAVLALPCILAVMDLTVLNLAAPHLSADLKPTSSQLLWILDIYGFMIAGSLITMGTLGDRIGRRKLLMIGAGAFGAASICAAFSRSPEMLIATRALLGVAGATLAPSTLSLIRNMFLDPNQRRVAIAYWAMSFSFGSAIGPLLGGVLLEHFHWGSVFLLNVPVMVLLLVLGPLLLPEFKDPQAGRLDLTSAGLSLVSALLIIFGLKRWTEFGSGALPIATLIGGFVIGTLFVRRQRALADPLIDLNLFRKRTFTTSLLLNFFGCVVAFGTFFFLAQYFQMVMGLTPLKAGILSAPSAVAFMAGSFLTPLVARRVRPGLVIAGGLLLSAAGFGLLTQLGRGPAIPLILVGTFVYAFGLAPIFTLATDLIIGAAPASRAGAAASISETSSELGGAVGMALLGSVGMAVYRFNLGTALPEGLTTEARMAARSTLGGAVAVAQSLPADIGAQVLQAARTAFTGAIHLSLWISVLVALALAWLAATVLERKN